MADPKRHHRDPDLTLPQEHRRDFLKLLAAGAVSTAVPLQTASAAEKTKTTARIVIAGAGAAGLAAASRLSQLLDGARIF